MRGTLTLISASAGMFHPGLGSEVERSPGPLRPYPAGLLCSPKLSLTYSLPQPSISLHSPFSDSSVLQASGSFPTAAAAKAERNDSVLSPVPGGEIFYIRDSQDHIAQEPPWLTAAPDSVPSTHMRWTWCSTAATVFMPHFGPCASLIMADVAAGAPVYPVCPPPLQHYGKKPSPPVLICSCRPTLPLLLPL